jgi:chorismate dehydratase
LLRVSLVDFLNARPLTWGLLHEPPAGVSISRDLPSACAAKLASGEADVGLIPSIEYQRIPGLKAVRGLGIAAASEVRSVLLVSDVSREKIRSVSLDPASRTSAALTRILLRRRYGLSPSYRETEDGRRKTNESPGDRSPDSRLPSAQRADARLIIGDPALKTRQNGRVVLDLAAEWRAFSGHPFVFAFWAVRNEAASTETAALLRHSYESGVERFGELVRGEAAVSGLSQAVVEDYLRHALHYDLERGDVEGLELFYRMAFEDGLVPKARPIEWLA